MGDRVTISFKSKKEESPILYHHWGGTKFPALAKHWFKEHYKQPEYQDKDVTKVLLQFIAWLGKHSKFSDSLDLIPPGEDWDNSNNGHYTIFVDSGKMQNGAGEYIE